MKHTMPVLRDSGRFKTELVVPNPPASFEVGVVESTAFKAVLTLNSARDAHYFAQGSLIRFAEQIKR